MLQVTGAIIVSTPSEVAIADVKKAITMYAIEGIGVPVLGLVENMSYFIAPETGEKHYVFGKDTTSQIAKSYDLPVFAQIPLSSSWRASLDSGKFFDAEVTDIDKVLEEMTQNIAQEVSIHNQKKLVKT
jgi:ATP-binding protein involved in chromosome partitioning